MDARFLQLLTSVRDSIADASLAGLPGANVRVLKSSKRRDRQDIGIPGAAIFPARSERQLRRGGTNVHERMEWPVAVVMLADDSADEDGDGTPGTAGQSFLYDQRMTWREAVADLFMGKRWSITDTRVCGLTCYYESRDVIDPNIWRRRRLWHASLLFNFDGRILRAT